MHSEQLITEIAARLNLPKLGFNDNNVCRIVADSQYMVDLEWAESSRALYVYSIVHTRASELKHRFAELLAANLFGHETGDAILSLDIERNEVFLHRKFELEQLDIEWFMQELDSFVDAVADWTQRLHRNQTKKDAAEKPSSGDHTASGLIKV